MSFCLPLIEILFIVQPILHKETGILYHFS